MVEQPLLPGIDERTPETPAKDDGWVWKAWCHIWQPESDLTGIGRYDAERLETFRAADKDWSPLCRALQMEFPELLDVRSPKVKWRKEWVSKLLEVVRSRAPRDATFVAQWRVLEVLDAGNRAERWHIPIVHIPVPLPAPHRPYFNDQIFRRMVRSQDVLDAFSGAPLSPVEPDKARWGQILGCCLVQAGIYEPRLLAKVPAAMAMAPQHLHWLDLELSSGNQQRPAVRRHYLDPFTRLLLLRLRSDGSVPSLSLLRWIPKNVYSCIRAFLSTVGLAEDGLPESLNDFRELVLARHALTVPPYLIGWADGHYRCTALPTESAARLFTALPDIPTGQRPGVRAHESASAVVDQEEQEDDEHETSVLPSLTALGSYIRKGNAAPLEKLKATLNNSNGQVPPAVLRLAEWAECWLFTAGRGRRAVAPKTAYDRFNAIAHRLVGQLAMDDPAVLTAADDFIEIYTTALDDTSSDGARRRVAKGLQSFHAFLQHRHGAPDLEGSGVFSISGRTPHAVDANLIDPEAFEWAVKWMERELEDEPDVAEIAVLIASLGYYAGLRRSEAEGLRVRDIDGEPGWDLVVQPNSDRRLKSVSAHRRVPLGVLLPPQRLERLERWWSRRAENTSEDQPLFRFEQDLGTPSERAATARAFRSIRNALYRATSAPELRYHHLRHSFANRLLLSLWAYEQYEHYEWLADEQAADEQPAKNPLPDWARSLLYPNLKSLRRTLLGHAPVQRRSLRLVSALMGHSGADITMTHYVHLADLLFADALRRRPSTVSDAALSILAGIEVEQVRRKRPKDAIDDADYIDQLAERLVPPSARLKAREPATVRRLTEPAEHYERCLEMTRWVCDTAKGEKSVHSFSPPWSQRTIDTWVEHLAELPEHHRKHRYGSLPDAIFDPPRTQQDHAIAKKTLEWLHGLAPAQRRRLIEAYRFGLLASNPLDVVHRSVVACRHWSQLLRQLGLIDVVDFYHTANTWKPADGPRQQLSYWRQQTGEQILKAPKRELPVLDREMVSTRGSVLTLHRREASPEPRYWAYGLTWAFTATALLDGNLRISQPARG